MPSACRNTNGTSKAPGQQFPAQQYLTGWDWPAKHDTRANQVNPLNIIYFQLNSTETHRLKGETYSPQ